MQVPHRCMNKLRCIFLLIHDKVKINLNCADKIIVFTLLKGGKNEFNNR